MYPSPLKLGLFLNVDTVREISTQLILLVLYCGVLIAQFKFKGKKNIRF